MLLYLNDVREGGGTRLSMLGLTVAPRKGCALVFFPCYDDGELDPRSLHEALPAVDRKYVCQIWVRQRDVPARDEAVAGVAVGAGRLGHRLLDALHAG